MATRSATRSGQPRPDRRATSTPTSTAVGSTDTPANASRRDIPSDARRRPAPGCRPVRSRRPRSRRVREQALAARPCRRRRVPAQTPGDDGQADHARHAEQGAGWRTDRCRSVRRRAARRCRSGTTTMRFGATRYGPAAPDDLPVGEVRRLDQHRGAGPVDPERDVLSPSSTSATTAGVDLPRARAPRRARPAATRPVRPEPGRRPSAPGPGTTRARRRGTAARPPCSPATRPGSPPRSSRPVR